MPKKQPTIIRNMGKWRMATARYENGKAHFLVSPIGRLIQFWPTNNPAWLARYIRRHYGDKS